MIQELRYHVILREFENGHQKRHDTVETPVQYIDKEPLQHSLHEGLKKQQRCEAMNKDLTSENVHLDQGHNMEIQKYDSLKYHDCRWKMFDEVVRLDSYHVGREKAHCEYERHIIVQRAKASTLPLQATIVQHVKALYKQILSRYNCVFQQCHFDDEH